MNKSFRPYQNMISLMLPIIAYCFTIMWAGNSLKQQENGRLINNIWLFLLFLVINGSYLIIHDRLLSKGKKMPFGIWVFQLITGGIIWWVQAKYFSFAYFSLFLIYQVYQFFLLVMPEELNQNWHRIFISSFFAGIIFPLIFSQTVPFAFSFTYIAKFLPIFFLFFFINGFNLLMSNSESRNTLFAGMIIISVCGLLLSGFFFGRGLLYGGLLLLLLGIFLLFNKKLRMMHLFTACSAICMIIAVLLLY